MSRPELYGLTEAELSLIDNDNPSYWWGIDEVSKIDSSNSTFEYINYTPDQSVAGTTFQQGPDTFTFTIRDKERSILPHKAFFDIKVSLTRAASTDAELAGFSNPIAHVLFDACSYSINNTVVETTDKHYPYSALVRGLVGKTRSWINTEGFLQGWALDGLTGAGDVNINLNRTVQAATRHNYSIYNETSTVGIRNKFQFDGSSGGNAADVAGILEQLNLLNLTAGNAWRPTYIVQQATNPGFFKRYSLAHPIPGEYVFQTIQSTANNVDGVPVSGNGGFLRGAASATQTYHVKLPLSDMFAFCRDFPKVYFGYFHTIQLTRNRDINQMVQRVVGSTARDLSHVTLQKIELWMPYVKPSEEFKAQFLTKLVDNSGKPLSRPIIFNPTRIIHSHFNPGATTTYPMNWNVGVVEGRPEHIYFFMTHNDNNRGISRMTFTHNFIKRLTLTVGARDFPIRELNVDLAKKDIGIAYEMYKNCCGYNDSYTDPALTPRDWMKFYPIFCFDLTTVEEDLFMGSKSLYVKATFIAPTQAEGFISSDNTDANAVADGAIHIPPFNAYVAITYRKSGYISSNTDGIKFLSNS